MPIIGYDGAELGGVGATEPGWGAQCFIRGTYTAGSDSAITSVSAYGDGTGKCRIAVYVISGGVPTARVTQPITISIGSGERWYTTNCRIPLTNGVLYGVAIDYYVDEPWNMRYGDPSIPLPGSGPPLSNNNDNQLPQAWSQSGTGGDAVMFYATVTEGRGLSAGPTPGRSSPAPLRSVLGLTHRRRSTRPGPTCSSSTSPRPTSSTRR